MIPFLNHVPFEEAVARSWFTSGASLAGSPRGFMIPRRARAVCMRVLAPPSAASACLLRESDALADRRSTWRVSSTMQERCQVARCQAHGRSCKCAWLEEGLTAAHVGVQAAAMRHTMALPVCWLCTKSRAA